MHIVVHQHPSDSPGYTRVMVRDPVGQTQAGAQVVAHYGNGQTHELLLHGQKEFDVPTGSRVVFPDGTELQTDPEA